MRAVWVKRHGGADAIEIDAAADPVASPGHALVRVAYAGVNFVDIYQRAGRYPGISLPWRLGIEGSGVVTDVAASEEWRVGDRVAFTTGVQGAYAERLSVPLDHLVRVPANTSLQSAAAVIEQGLTAMVLADDVARLPIGGTAVVHAAAGGVGGLLVQLLKLRGARVIGIVSSAQKAAWLESRGIEAIRNDSGSPWRQQLAERTDSRGADAVFDSVGATTFEDSLASLKERGHLVLFGAASGPVASVSIPALMAKSATLTRPVLPHFLRDPAVLRARAAALFAAVHSGDLQLRIQSTLPLAQAREAHALLESRAARGKVLLKVDDSGADRA